MKQLKIIRKYWEFSTRIRSGRKTSERHYHSRHTPTKPEFELPSTIHSTKYKDDKHFAVLWFSNNSQVWFSQCQWSKTDDTRQYITTVFWVLSILLGYSSIYTKREETVYILKVRYCIPREIWQVRGFSLYQPSRFILWNRHLVWQKCF